MTYFFNQMQEFQKMKYILLLNIIFMLLSVEGSVKAMQFKRFIQFKSNSCKLSSFQHAKSVIICFLLLFLYACV